ncbi:MAG: YaiI/YqxD family protein [Pseudomonadota bacterium]
MHIWVDADACPVVVKEILYRAAERKQVPLILVANKALNVPRSPWISSKQVGQGFDVADEYIAGEVRAGDIVITADIPLAAEVLKKGAHAINPRGERYDVDSINQILGMRDFMDTLRGSGIHTGGPPPLNQTDRRNFANELDRLLATTGK